ncbi:MAG: linked oxidase domain protein [Actinomycetia bacterium]|jgi:FAD/FMN-containing dehydrogenase|nr:linked oxidase domain protein [Actinomycetes bacterium]
MRSRNGDDPELALRLSKDIEGRVIALGDPDYDDARAVFYGGIDRRPAAIARVARDADVARVIAEARETGLELAIRSGGHSLVGHSVTEGGIVLDLSEMQALDIDAESRTAWAESGVTAGRYSEAAAEHGLATGFGDSPSVGVGGITLGGGVGFLVRKYGLTIDALLAADVVTAAGEVLRVDEESHPDLFWAIRGGGGNFGVATRFRFRLHEVPAIVGGILILPATLETIAGWAAASESAPEELSTIATVMKAPPMPFLPEAVHGKIVIFGMIVHAGGGEAGERAVTPFRELAEPLGDMLKEMPYPGIYMEEEGDFHPIASDRTMFLDRVDEDVAARILDRISSSDAMMAAAQFRVLGGAMARVPADATAFAHRSSKIMVNVAALFESVEDRPRYERWVQEFADVLRQKDQGAYVNFLEDEGPERVRAAYPGATWDRLREIKRRYDPTNLFRLNQNIPPADEDA